MGRLHCLVYREFEEETAVELVLRVETQRVVVAGWGGLENERSLAQVAGESVRGS